MQADLLVSLAHFFLAHGHGIDQGENIIQLRLFFIMPHEIKGKSRPQVTLGFSVHRPEMVPLTFALMQRHDALFLEEPPSADFNDMLQGAVSIDDYLMPLDVEYPEFSRRMCRRLRKLHSEGKVIVQVEPFLEVLLGIHDFFAEGHTPGDLPKDSLQYPVYLAERKATGALLTYYQTAVSGSFEETIAAIIKFARLDGARFRLRDSLRAQELVPLIEKYPSAFIEAGAIHYQLGQLLRQKLPQQTRVRPVFLADFALKKLDKNGQLYGPGDQLTLLYIFHPTIAETERHRLLAARSIIYAKIIEKEESEADAGTFPHLRDELACIRATGNLNLRDCRELFPLIRRSKTAEARQIVNNYLDEAGLQTQ